MSDLANLFDESVNPMDHQQPYVIEKWAAQEIERLRSELTAAQAENEAVRLANLDVMNHYDDARAEIERLRWQYQELLAEKNFIGRKGLKALFLRKQAEAVEEMAYKVRKGQEEASHLVTAASIYEGLLSYSANYRQQADELEK